MGFVKSLGSYGITGPAALPCCCLPWPWPFFSLSSPFSSLSPFVPFTRPDVCRSTAIDNHTTQTRARKRRFGGAAACGYEHQRHAIVPFSFFGITSRGLHERRLQNARATNADFRQVCTRHCSSDRYAIANG